MRRQRERRNGRSLRSCRGRNGHRCRLRGGRGRLFGHRRAGQHCKCLGGGVERLRITRIEALVVHIDACGLTVGHSADLIGEQPQPVYQRRLALFIPGNVDLLDITVVNTDGAIDGVFAAE